LVFRAGVRGQRDGGGGAALLGGKPSYGAEKCEPVLLRHRQVSDEDVRALRHESIKGFLNGAGGYYLRVAAGEDLSYDFAGVRFIIHHEDPQVFERWEFCSSRLR